MPLTMTKAGDTVTIRKITGKDEVRQHLAELGFVVGETVTVVNEISGNLILQVKEARIALDKTLALSSESLDLTRRTDLAQMRAVTDFALEHCTEDQTVYINMDSNGYSGTTFAYSDPAHPQLQTMILWESSVPSTHGFPTGIWTSEYVMVTDRVDEGGIVGPINAALRTQSPAAVHYEYVTEFPLDGITLYCYRRTARPDAEEADYFKQVFAEYDARWPEIFSQRIDEYMQSVQ